MALARAKVRSRSPTKIATEFNLRHYGRPVSVQAVRKWLEGNAVPSAEKIVTLGKWLGVSPSWLLFGEPYGTTDSGALPCANPVICGDFNRLSTKHQDMILELIALMRHTELQA